MNKLTMLAVVLLAGCPSGGAKTSTMGPGGGGGEEGGSLEERKYWRGEMDYVQRSLDAGEEACGVKFSFEWRERENLRAEAEKNNNSPNGICASIIDEVTSLCREGADEKGAVTAKIKGFTCGYGNPRALSFDGGVVVYAGNHEEANFSDWAKPWLMKNL